MPRQLDQRVFDARIKALRDNPDNIVAAAEALKDAGHETDYEALRAFRNRYRGLVESPPGTAEAALKRIVERIARVPKDAGPVALATCLGEVKTIASETVRGD